MSRIGKKPIEIPQGVEVKIGENTITVKGPRGTLERTFPSVLKVSKEDGNIIITPVDLTRKTKSLYGLTRTLIANMVEGVTRGFEKVLELSGVGYKVQLQGKNLILNLGFSHQINYPLPEGIEASVERQSVITIKGINKELVGQTAANIRSFKKPDPYKAKGIKYRGEHIIRKAGKAGR